MKRIFLALICWVLCFTSMEAQESFLIQGSVKDFNSKQALVAVNIFDQESSNGTFSDIDGNFKLKVKSFPVKLIFSSIGYENFLLEIKSPPTEELEVFLKQSSIFLPGVEVIAEPKIEKLTQPVFTVKDFIIKDDMILLVKFQGLSTGNILELCDLEGKVLHSIPIKIKGDFEELHQSCLGNIHLVGKQEIIEVDIQTRSINLISRYPRAQFDKFIQPCVEASEHYVYMKKSKLLGQYAQFDFVSKTQQQITRSVRVVDDLNIMRMPEELGQYGQSEQYFSAANAYPDNPELTRPELLDSWKALFYAPIYSPLYNTGNEICIFNHTMNFLQFYTLDGQLLRQFPISYHKEKHWEKKILKDQKTGKFYTIYRDKLGKRFYEINLVDGTVNAAFKISCDFVEKMIIYDGFMYYQDSGILSGEVNRILHKVKVEG